MKIYFAGVGSHEQEKERDPIKKEEVIIDLVENRLHSFFFRKETEKSIKAIKNLREKGEENEN